MTGARCASCAWANWSWGGRCIRPEMDQMVHVRQPARKARDPALPHITREDFCGDHVTPAQLEARREVMRERPDATRVFVLTPAMQIRHRVLAKIPPLDEPLGGNPHLLAMLVSRQKAS